MKLLREATIDDAFNAQLKKVEVAVRSLQDIVVDMQKPGSATKPTPLQKMAVRHAIEDLQGLLERMQ